MAKAAALKPVYLVQGDDPTLLSDEVRRVVSILVGDQDPAMTVEEIVGDDGDVAPLLDACLTPPFFTDRRVVIARDIGRFTGDSSERIAAYLAEPLESTHLVLVAGGGRTPPKILNAVKKIGEVVDGGSPSGRARTSWLAERMREAPINLDRAAAALVSEHLGEDLGRLNSLLSVLSSAYGDGAQLTPADVEPFLGEAGGVAPWELTDAIDKGDTAAALHALHRMMEAGGRHALVVLSTLHRHFQSMLRLDGANARTEAEAAEVLGLRGGTFPARKALSQARKLGWVGISEALVLIADADVDLRGVRAWPDELVLEVLVARLCRLARFAR